MKRILMGLTSLMIWALAASHAQAVNSSKVFSKHKGFMVFLNWYYLQDAPMIITQHFHQIKSQGSLKLYRGSYGAFHNIDISVCNQKITEVLARSQPMPGGIDAFLKIWLEPRLYQKSS